MPSPWCPLCPGIILGDGRARPLRHHHLHHQKASGPSKIKVPAKIPNLKLRSHHLPTPVPSACSCLNSACPHHHPTAHPMCSKASAHTLGSPVQGHSLPACSLQSCLFPFFPCTIVSLLPMQAGGAVPSGTCWSGSGISPKLLRPGTVCLGALSVERILSAGNQLPLLLIG